MMEFLGLPAGRGPLEGMFFEDLQFEGGDSDAVMWGAEVPDEVKAASPGRGDRLRGVGILAGIRLAQAGLPFTIIEKNAGPAAPGGRTATRAPGSISAATSTATRSSPPTTGASTTASSPSCATYFDGVVDKYGLGPHCRFGTTVIEA